MTLRNRQGRSNLAATTPLPLSDPWAACWSGLASNQPASASLPPTRDELLRRHRPCRPDMPRADGESGVNGW
jgi:hypothetical protein